MLRTLIITTLVTPATSAGAPDTIQTDGENVGEAPTHMVIVELKEAGKTCSTKP